MCALIDPRLMIEPPPAVPHHLRDCLGGEEVVADIDGDAVVPEGDVHLGDPVAMVVGRVVHQDANRAEPLGRPSDRRLQGRHVAHVTFLEEDLGPVIA